MRLFVKSTPNTMKLFTIFAVLLSSIAAVSAFMPNTGRINRLVMLNKAVEPEAVELEAGEPEMETQGNFFDGNKRVRLGRSKDQDGKSNIWSIEPAMQVVEEEEAGPKKNLFILGAVLGAVAIALPSFSALTALLPDPADF